LLNIDKERATWMNVPLGNPVTSFNYLFQTYSFLLQKFQSLGLERGTHGLVPLRSFLGNSDVRKGLGITAPGIH
jgi:hypothetical protein